MQRLSLCQSMACCWCESSIQLSQLPVDLMKVTTCCTCAKHARQTARRAARRTMVAQAESGTKEADTGSAAPAEEQGDEMDLVR